MKAFRFTLEAVRVLRQRQEQVAMDDYARAILARQQAVERLEVVQHQITAGWHELRARLAAGCPAVEAAQAHEYHRTLERRRQECANAVGVAERRVNAAMQSMLVARQQREIVDKFFQRQKDAHGRDLARAEQKILDDLAGRRVNSILSWNPTEALS